MMFYSKDFYADKVGSKDIKEVLEVYNSNNHFLINHVGTNKVTSEWLHKELKEMKDVGFSSYKIVETRTDKIIGIIDFKLDDETYLSLLMIDSDFHGNGFGKLIFQKFEEYVKSFKSNCIRIDVGINYDKSVLDFWVNKGFVKYKDVELNYCL